MFGSQFAAAADNALYSEFAVPFATVLSVILFVFY